MSKSLYAIAIGSNRRHHRHGPPAGVVAAAIAALQQSGMKLKARAPLFTTPALGPAGRDFANSAVLVSARLDPPELLRSLKRIERMFGRRGGRRWGPRVLDLDIILWSGGAWADGNLVVPHPSFRYRGFVLDPLNRIAGAWRDPLTGLSVAQLRFRARRRNAAD